MSDPGECRVPIYQYGKLYATQPAPGGGAHDWRLLERNTQEVWYCTRCRLVDVLQVGERDVAAPDTED